MDRGFIYLNKTNFLNNLLYLKKLTQKNLCLVVKANAYGHGVEWAVNCATKAGVAWFAVASVDEGIQVKEHAKEARVLLLSEPSISQIEKIRINNLDLTVYNESFINALIDNGSTFNVHLKIDTGMHRLGCSPEKFKDIFRNADVLILDDIQFISGKDVTQEEFFYTFNSLIENQSQVVISSDRSPNDLTEFRTE